MFPWWIYVAFKQMFPSRRGVSFFAAVSILGVALGVLGLFGTQSVMNGFHAKISQKLRDTTGDVIIKQGGRPISEWKGVLEKLSSYPEVVAAEPCAKGPVMMTFNRVPVFPILRSYDTIRDKSVLPMEKGFIRLGKLDELDDDSVILGQRLAYAMRANVGDTVEVYSPAMLDNVGKDEIPMAARLKVVALLRTDFSSVDSNVALVSLRRMQELYSLEDSIHEICLRLKDPSMDEDFAIRISKEVSPLSVSTWLDANESFLSVIKMEKTMMSIIILLIIIVASFSICISLYTSVLRKTRETGLMCAMGARPWHIICIYCLQGLLIGVVGSLAGLALTVLVMHFRESLVEIMVGRERLAEFYYFSSLPVKYEFADAWRACVFATGLCTLAGFIPALRAAAMRASEAMRNE